MRMRIAVLALAVLALGGKAQAAGPPPLRVLFVGNSLTATNDLPGMVAALGKASRFRDVEVRTLAPGGWSLEDHWRLGEAPRVLASQHWDAIVLQQGPVGVAGEPGQPARVGDADRGGSARAWHAAGALHGLARELPLRGVPRRARVVPQRRPRGARRALPGRRRVARAWRRDPKLPLYGPDGFHPSRLGSYLAAVVIYAGLVKASPVGLPRLWVSAKRARVLQAAAAEALRRT